MQLSKKVKRERRIQIAYNCSDARCFQSKSTTSKTDGNAPFCANIRAAKARTVSAPLDADAVPPEQPASPGVTCLSAHLGVEDELAVAAADADVVVGPAERIGRYVVLQDFTLPVTAAGPVRSDTYHGYRTET